MPVIRPSEARIQNFIDDFKKETLAQKYLYKHTWLSGGQTTVYPIAIEKRSIRIQWSCDKRIFNKFIQRIVNRHNDIFSGGLFWKSDGSCPSTITFYFKGA